jgi:hypothetical protein
VIVPVVASASYAAAPVLPVPDAAADAAAAALAVVPAVTALALSATSPAPRARVLAVLFVSAIAALALVSLLGFPRWIGPLQTIGVVGAAHAVGAGIGGRVEHPGHMLPASCVAAAADVASVLSPEGPSHAVATSEGALAWLALSAPVPGTTAIGFVLGVGDLVMLALAFAVAARFGVSRLRVGLLAAAGIAVALALSATLGRAVPALVPIGAFLVAGVTQFRTLHPRDRRVAAIAVAVALAAATAVVLRALRG